MLETIPTFARLVAELSKFPGIGKKTATRLAFFLLRSPDEEAHALAAAIHDLKAKIRFCSVCHHVTEADPCALCSAPGRDNKIICVVEEPQDLMSIERSRSYRGRYHVLHGALSPLDGIGPDQLHISDLLERLRDEQIDEVIVATNFTVEGEATALYLGRLIQPLGVRVTRPAHGIPMGSDLEYVDEATVSRAVQGRQDL